MGRFPLLSSLLVPSPAFSTSSLPSQISTLILLLLGRVAFGAQQPIASNFPVDDLSACASVRRSVCPVHCGKTANKQYGLDPDAVWRHSSDGSRDEAGSGGLGIGPREGVLLGANLGCAIVTNGDLTAYVCKSAATRPSSQITLGKLVSVFTGNKTYTTNHS